MLCKICGRDSSNEDGYCRYHQVALENLQAAYENWQKASGVSWEEYIESICRIDETGRWVQEVAEQIRSGDAPSTLR
jgi:hypothetical protein